MHQKHIPYLFVLNILNRRNRKSPAALNEVTIIIYNASTTTYMCIYLMHTCVTLFPSFFKSYPFALQKLLF